MEVFQGMLGFAPLTMVGVVRVWLWVIYIFLKDISLIFVFPGYATGIIETREIGTELL